MTSIYNIKIMFFYLITIIYSKMYLFFNKIIDTFISA